MKPNQHNTPVLLVDVLPHRQSVLEDARMGTVGRCSGSGQQAQVLSTLTRLVMWNQDGTNAAITCDRIPAFKALKLTYMHSERLGRKRLLPRVGHAERIGHSVLRPGSTMMVAAPQRPTTRWTRAYVSSNTSEVPARSRRCYSLKVTTVVSISLSQTLCGNYVERQISSASSLKVPRSIHSRRTSCHTFHVTVTDTDCGATQVITTTCTTTT